MNFQKFLNENPKYLRDFFSMNSDTKIEFLNRKDIKSFFLFINDNWKKNYIFIKNKIFFDWQFYNSKRNTYNFVIAKTK